MNKFSIKDLEQLSGIKAHTIRIWEQRYDLIKPKRTGTNIRFYSNDELKTVLNVSLLNRYGFKISRIDQMSRDEMKEKILTLSQAEAQQERIVNELIQCMIDLETEQFENVLDKHIASKGIEKTITNIVFSFLEKVGVLWQTNHINPAHEHLVSNIIRRKLMIGIEKAKTLMQINKTVLLFLPEGEYHEVGLLFIQYLLINKGLKVLYLGADVPLSDVAYVVNLKKPIFIYTHLTAIAHNFNLEKFLNQFSSKIPNTKFVLSGQLIQNYKKKIPSNVELKKSLGDVLDYIKVI